MQECFLFHTGVYEMKDGVIKNNKVYFKRQEGNLFLPEVILLVREECENGLVQFMVEEKWGFADIHTGEIIIDPVWDYLGPFYHGYAHAALDVELEISNDFAEIIIDGGKHGYIGIDGEILIPIEYDDAAEIPYRKNDYFKVVKDGKYGLIDKNNKMIIPFKWDYLEIGYSHDLIFCAIDKSDEIPDKERKIYEDEVPDSEMKWGVYDQNFNLIIEPELDERPNHYKTYINKNIINWLDPKYYLLKKKRKFGVLCKDGSLISNIELTKKQAISLIKSL